MFYNQLALETEAINTPRKGSVVLTELMVASTIDYFSVFKASEQCKAAR